MCSATGSTTYDCWECDDNGDCTSSPELVCKTTTHTCVWCTNDSHCPPDEPDIYWWCNTSTNRCEAEFLCMAGPGPEVPPICY